MLLFLFTLLGNASTCLSITENRIKPSSNGPRSIQGIINTLY